MSQSWLELSFQTTHEASDLLAEYLRAIGAAGVQIQDGVEIKAILQDPNSLTYADADFWQTLDDTVQIKAYFAVFADKVHFHDKPSWHEEKRPDQAGSQAKLEASLHEQLQNFRQHLDLGPGYLGARQVSDANWAENWKKHYHTLHLTPRLVINPSWIDYTAQPGERVIQMDPGSAFGTGTHETTAMCARLLEATLSQGDSVLDLGTGSGILAIAASRLGAGSIEAIDIDPLAVAVAQSNIKTNAVDVSCHGGELKAAQAERYDLIVANIIADVICELMPEFREKMAFEGHLIASGIIEKREEDVLDSARKAGLALQTRLQEKDWLAFVFRKEI